MLGSTGKIQSLEEIKKTIPSQSTPLTGINILFKKWSGPEIKRHQTKERMAFAIETGGGAALERVSLTMDKWLFLCLDSFYRLHCGTLEGRWPFWLPVSERNQPNHDQEVHWASQKLPSYRWNGEALPKRKKLSGGGDAGVGRRLNPHGCCIGPKSLWLPWIAVDPQAELQQEGHVFIYDQKKMDGLPGRDHNGERLQITPGLCLFYLNPENKMMPIAIQVWSRYVAESRGLFWWHFYCSSCSNSPLRRTPSSCPVTQRQTGCWPRCSSEMWTAWIFYQSITSWIRTSWLKSLLSPRFAASPRFIPFIRSKSV